MPSLSHKGRLARLTLTVPLLAFFVSIMDYATFSWTRDRLQIIPIMWDQKENYASTASRWPSRSTCRWPMSRRQRYSDKSIAAIDKPHVTLGAGREARHHHRHEQILLGPTKLPGVTITPDPSPMCGRCARATMFSPEFGGMTANVEFEALTAFQRFPAGRRHPYQQYVRAPVPSMATFLKSEGYETRAIHPGTNWFWNRTPVYADFGFDDFKSEENLPYLQKRGPLASDAAMTEEIIREADATDDPFFFFAVSLQNHGPYEPYRYYNPTHKVQAPTSQWAKDSLLSYAEGASDADKGLERLVEWARRGRVRP